MTSPTPSPETAEPTPLTDDALAELSHVYAEVRRRQKIFLAASEAQAADPECQEKLRDFDAAAESFDELVDPDALIDNIGRLLAALTLEQAKVARLVEAFKKRFYPFGIRTVSGSLCAGRLTRSDAFPAVARGVMVGHENYFANTASGGARGR